jgi:DnaK suppressor protein
MTKADLNRFRKLLRNSQAELENAIRKREALAIDTSADELDRIQHAVEREFAIDNLERESIRLRDVRAALGRIEAGSFGICDECEEPINPKRLAAVPWTSSCIVCQEAADRAQSHSLNEMDPALMLVAAYDQKNRTQGLMKARQPF